ncbi:Alpha/Beta hydrolase protein [Syncephalis fuscata]|nr:Alpha/Beta hydrolase protein [Syncephalis fuscata]
MDHENGNSDAGSISAHRDDMQGISPDRILIAGDSAGGGLTVALLLALRDLRLPLPAGAITLSPWLDQTSSSTSATANSTTDYLPNPDIIGKVDKPWWQTDVNVEHFYVRQRSLLTCPYVSPLWATDLSGLPPILMQVGGAERFKDEVMQFAQHAVLLPQARPNSSGNSLRLGRTASIVRMPTSVRLEVYEEMPHVWACFPNMPATRVSQARAAKFIHSCLTASPQLYPEYLQIAPDGELLQHSLLPLDTIHQTR